MKRALLISLSLLSAPAFAADPIQEAFDGHIQLLMDAGSKRDTLLAQERFAQFRSLFCGTMKNPQEAEYCKSGIDEGVGTLIQQMSEMMDSPPEDEAAKEQPWQNAGTLADNGELAGDVYSTSAQALYADYKSNEPATAKKIDGKPVLIHGDVLEVRASGTTGVLLKMISRDSSSDRINPLMLEIAKESHDAALKLKNLDAVDVECKTVGLDVVTLIGKGCVIH